MSVHPAGLPRPWGTASCRKASSTYLLTYPRAAQVDLGSTHLAPNKPAVHVQHSFSRFSALSLRSATAFDGLGVLLFRATAGALRGVDVMLSDDAGSR